MEYTTEEYEQIVKVVVSCEEMVEGKFILADTKIAAILQSITNCKPVYDLLSNCMENFNYEKEFARAKIKMPTKPNMFVLPDDKLKVLPFVFCILVDIERHKLNLHDFISEFFSSEDVEPYKNFTSKIILPFMNTLKEVLLQEYNIVEKTTVDEENETTTEANSDTTEVVEVKLPENITDSIAIVINEISQVLSADKKVDIEDKENGLIILRAMLKANLAEDYLMLNALIVGFECFCKKIKSVKYYFQELKDMLIKFYAN